MTNLLLGQERKIKEERSYFYVFFFHAFSSYHIHNFSSISSLMLGALYLQVSSTVQWLRIIKINCTSFWAPIHDEGFSIRCHRKLQLKFVSGLPTEFRFTEGVAGCLAPEKRSNSDSSYLFLVTFPRNFSTLFGTTSFSCQPSLTGAVSGEEH